LVSDRVTSLRGCFLKPVAGELLFRQATWDATLLHPFLYVIDSKRAFNFGEVQHKAEVPTDVSFDDVIQIRRDVANSSVDLIVDFRPCPKSS